MCTSCGRLPGQIVLASSTCDSSSRPVLHGTQAKQALLHTFVKNALQIKKSSKTAVQCTVIHWTSSPKEILCFFVDELNPNCSSPEPSLTFASHLMLTLTLPTSASCGWYHRHWLRRGQCPLRNISQHILSLAASGMQAMEDRKLYPESSF